jgi:hypothetical protein
MTLLSGAERTPIEGKPAKLHFKSNGTNLKAKGSRAPLNNAAALGFGFLHRPISCIHAVVRVSPVTPRPEALQHSHAT